MLKERIEEIGVNFYLFFIMDIANYLKEKGLNVKIHETKKPDIVFTIDNKKIAIEVES